MTDRDLLELADLFDRGGTNNALHRAVAAELRRLHQHELSNELWHKKTEWLQNSYTTAELGIHRADVMKQRIDRLRSLNQELVEALNLAVRQNSHDMLMTGDELRTCETALAKAKQS